MTPGISKRKSVALRIVFGAIAIAVLLGILWLDWHLEQTGSTIVGLPVGVLAAVLALIAFIEMVRLLATKGVEILWISGGLGAAGIATLPVWWQLLDSSASPQGNHILLVFGFLVVVIFFDQMVQQSVDTALLRISATAMSVLYLGVGCALALAIRVEYKTPALVLFLASVKATDVGAYFVGMTCGKHKLIPGLSPAKSWEGLIGGLAAGTLAAVGIDALTSHVWPFWTDCFDWPLWQTAVFGAAVGVAGQFGDLCESLLKRSAHVKDSGQVLPEFGGILDILDSILISAPVAMILLAAMK